MSDIVERLRSTNALPIIRPTKLEREAADEIERLRAGLQLIASDKNRLMNEVARQTAASILGGKPIGEVPEWPTREEAEKRAAELMAIGRATLGENDDWLCFQRPAQPKVTP